MKPSAILAPCVALVLLTAAVWVKLYVDRLREMKRRAIDPQALARASDAADTLEHTAAADNFRNLFEIPVLFYVLCMSLALTNTVNAGFVFAAWAFVALRVVHSFIHCTYNQVTHRFAVYVLSTLIVFVMWGAFGVWLVSR